MGTKLVFTRLAYLHDPQTLDKSNSKLSSSSILVPDISDRNHQFLFLQLKFNLFPIHVLKFKYHGEKQLYKDCILLKHIFKQMVQINETICEDAHPIFMYTILPWLLIQIDKYINWTSKMRFYMAIILKRFMREKLIEALLKREAKICKHKKRNDHLRQSSHVTHIMPPKQ